MPTRFRAAAVVAACILAGAAVSWRCASRPVQSAGGTILGSLPHGGAQGELNVLVITLDTTRADRLGAYGFGGVATPNLDRLAREGILFEQTTSSAPLTLPAHASLFTGRFPPRHGVRHNGARLDPQQVTLAELLRARGFHTGAFIASFVLDSRFGLNQGFDEYEEDFGETRDKPLKPTALRRRADQVVDEALDWLRAAAGGRFLAWLHFYDPHAPYDPPEPYRSLYADEPYHGEIAFMDAQVGRVLAFLDEHHLSDRTIVVAVGDHGESLGEHGEATHGLFVYESVLRVPFIIRAPFDLLRNRRVESRVRSVDLPPTILDLLGMEAPSGIDGMTLAPLMTGTDRGRKRQLEAYAESMHPLRFGWSDLHALRAGRFKLILAPRPELYDLDADPHEQVNLYEERRPLAERIARRLREMEDRALPGEAADVSGLQADPEARTRLAALGYIGGPGADVRAPRSRSNLADPKDKIELYNQMIRSRVDQGGRP